MRTTWTAVVLIAVVTALLSSALGVSALAAFGLGAAVVLASAVPALLPAVHWSRLAWRIRAELRDPSGPTLGVVVAVAILVAGSGPLLALGAGFAILALKVATALAIGSGSPRPRLPAGSAAEEWLSRSERAVFAMRRIQPARESGLAERFAETRAGAEETLVLVRRLAAHEATVSQLRAGTDPARLWDDLRNLERELAEAATPALREEIGRALGALRDRHAALLRLGETDTTLLARMRTAAFGLEALAARLAEITVIPRGAADPTAYTRVAELADELDALRAGLVEADTIGRSTVDELVSGNQLEVGR